MKLGPRIVMGLAGMILLAGLAFVAVGSRPPPERTFKGDVKVLLPKPEEIPGWKMDFLPIAGTPEIKARVDQELNYDDAVFATYANGTVRVSVYVAYWAPGKMSHRLVAGHTPDICWVAAGWRKEEARSGVILTDALGQNIQPAEERAMSINGTREYVLFWHLLDGTATDYGTGWRPPWHAIWGDIWAKGVNQRPEQFFVRISSNRPVHEFWNSEIIKLLLQRFPMKQMNKQI